MVQHPLGSAHWVDQGNENLGAAHQHHDGNISPSLYYLCRSAGAPIASACTNKRPSIPRPPGGACKPVQHWVSCQSWIHFCTTDWWGCNLQQGWCLQDHSQLSTPNKSDSILRISCTGRFEMHIRLCVVTWFKNLDAQAQQVLKCMVMGILWMQVWAYIL